MNLIPCLRGEWEEEKREENKRSLFECRGMSPRTEKEKETPKSRKVR